MSKVVVWDVDGVLADFASGFSWHAVRKYGLDLSLVKSNGAMAKWSDWDDIVTPEQAGEIWEDIKSDGLWWLQLMSLLSDGERRDMHKLRPAGFTNLYLTARVGVEPERQTRAWLRQNGLPEGRVVVSGDKDSYCRALASGSTPMGPVEVVAAIEDAPSQIRRLAGVVPLFVRDWAYNRGIEPDVPRVSSVSEFVARVMA